MMVFLEKFFIPICVLIFGAVLITNPMGWRAEARFYVGLLIVFLAYWASLFIQRNDEEQPPALAAAPLQHEVAKPVAQPTADIETKVKERRFPAWSSPYDKKKTPVEPPEKREFVKVDAEYMFAFFDDHTTVQADKLLAPFLGKWMKVSGKLDNVTMSGASPHVVLNKDVDLKSDRKRFFSSVSFEFDPEWSDRLQVLRKNDKLTIVGRILSVDKFDVTLEHCEFSVDE